MKKRALFIIFSGLSVLHLTGCRDKQQAGMPAPNVQVIEVIQKDIPITEEFVGQTFGLYDIRIQARVEGFLEGMHFEEGSLVNKGQLLYTIDRQPFEAKVAGNLAQLAEANTMLVKAESDLTRIEPLADINAVSKSDLDAAIAQRDAARGSVEAAEAALRFARIELGYTNIYSPINGIIGKTEVYPGDFIGRGIASTVLNEVSRIDTVLVNFFIPEEKYLNIVRPLIEKQDTLRLQRRKDMKGLTMILADGSTYPYKGKIKFVNRQVDASTGTLLVQATFPNPGMILRPGQFARIEGVIDVVENGLLVPQRCVQELQGNYNVFVVNDEDVVEFREIAVAGTYKISYLIVTSGLKPGERIVYEGLQKVRNGITVNPQVQEISDINLEN